MTRSSILHVVFAAPLTLFYPATASAADTLADEFKAIRDGWDRLAKLDQSGRSYSIALSGQRSGQPSPMATVQFQGRPSGFVLHKIRQEGVETLVVVNPEYRFILSKRNAAAKWALAVFSDKPATPKDRVIDMLAPSGNIERLPLSSLFGVPHTEYLSLANPKVTSIRRASPTKVHVRFTRRVLGEKGQPSRTAEAEFVLDPTADHCLIEGRDWVHGPDKPFVMKRMVEQLGGQLVCRSVSYEEPNATLETFAYDQIKCDRPVPESELYLSHYGFPEPVDVTPPPPSFRWWPYLLGAAIICGLASSYAWYRGRRYPRTDAPK